MDSEIENDQTAESKSGAQVDFPSLYTYLQMKYSNIIDYVYKQ